MTTQVSAVTTGSISIIGNVGSAVTQGAFIGVMTFLMVLERKKLGAFLLDLAPEKSGRYIKKHFTEVQNILHAWIRGQLILGASIFFIALIGLSIIEWSFGASTGKIWTLAMIAGLMEFIPYIGPLIALIPALVVGL
jgi:predicted PurR-regulated permease PerM